MKKTLSLIFTFAGVAMAGTPIELGTPTTQDEYAVYTLPEDFGTGNNSTVGITLNVDALRNRFAIDGMNDASCDYCDFVSFFTLQGSDPTDPGVSISQGLGVNAWRKKIVLTGFKTSYVDITNQSSYKASDLLGISNLTLPWNTMDRLSMVLVSTENSPKDVLTCYISFTDQSGKVTTYSGEYTSAPRDPWPFTTLNINTDYVKEFEVYNDSMSAEDAAKLSVTLITGESAPEPTTATLSLLALAGLAARRRR